MAGSGILADGQHIKLQGNTNLNFHLGDVTCASKFLVAKIDNHILEKHSCQMDFVTHQLVISKNKLNCCDSAVHLLMAKVQVKFALQFSYRVNV